MSTGGAPPEDDGEQAEDANPPNDDEEFWNDLLTLLESDESFDMLWSQLQIGMAQDEPGEGYTYPFDQSSRDHTGEITASSAQASVIDVSEQGQLKDPADYATDDDDTQPSHGTVAQISNRGQLKDPADYATDDGQTRAARGSAVDTSKQGHVKVPADYPSHQEEMQRDQQIFTVPDCRSTDDREKRITMIAMILFYFSRVVHEQTSMKLSSAAKRKLKFLLPGDNRTTTSSPGDVAALTPGPKRKRPKFYNVREKILVPENWLRELTESHPGVVTGSHEESGESHEESEESGESQKENVESSSSSTNASDRGTMCNLCGQVRKGHLCKFRKVYTEWLEKLAKRNPELLPQPRNTYHKILLLSAPLWWLQELMESNPELVPDDIREDAAEAAAAHSDSCPVSKLWLRNLVSVAQQHPDDVPADCKGMCQALLADRYEKLKETLQEDSPAEQVALAEHVRAPEDIARGTIEAEADDDNSASNVERNEGELQDPEPEQGSHNDRRNEASDGDVVEEE